MPPTVNLNDTLGALEIGVLISLFLFGIVTVQTSVYYDRFPKDPWHVKFLVAFVWVLELGHSLLISYLIYSTTITWYGQPQKLVKFESLNATVIFGAIITLTVQVAISNLFLNFRLFIELQSHRFFSLIVFGK
jgi:hypothetical protein